MTDWCIVNWNGMEGSGHCLSGVPMQHLPMKICQATWCHEQDSHKVLPSEPIPSVDLYIIHHHYQNKRLIHILVYISMSIP